MFGEALHRSTSFPCQTTPKLIESSNGGIIDNTAHSTTTQPVQELIKYINLKR